MLPATSIQDQYFSQLLKPLLLLVWQCISGQGQVGQSKMAQDEGFLPCQFLPGIAGLRLIYVKFHILMSSNVVEHLISNLILMVALAMTGLFTAIVLTTRQRGQDLTSVCFGLSAEMEELTGAILDHTPPIRWALVASGLVLEAFQMFAYAKIFNFLTSNDKLMVGILPENSIARRNRQNAIDFSGHVIQFAVEFTFMIISPVIPRLMSEASIFYSRYFSLGTYGVTGFLCIVSNNSYRCYIKDRTSGIIVGLINRLRGNTYWNRLMSFWR